MQDGSQNAGQTFPVRTTNRSSKALIPSHSVLRDDFNEIRSISDNMGATKLQLIDFLIEKNRCTISNVGFLGIV